MEKVYVDATNMIRIICPECGLEKNINVFKFKDTHKRLKAKCKCGEVFRLSLDFRKYYRKNVRLAGEYLAQDTDEKGEIIIDDISASGIRFASLKPHYISRDDIVNLKFTLDNPMKSIIHTPVKIIWIMDRNIGAKFFDPKSINNDLGFYLRA